MCDVNHDQHEHDALETIKWRTVIREFLLALERGDLDDLLEAGRDKDEKKVKIFSPTEQQKKRVHNEEKNAESKGKWSHNLHEGINGKTDIEQQSFHTGA